MFGTLRAGAPICLSTAQRPVRVTDFAFSLCQCEQHNYVKNFGLLKL